MKKLFFRIVLLMVVFVNYSNAEAKYALPEYIYSTGPDVIENIFRKDITSTDHYGQAQIGVYVVGAYSVHDVLRTKIGSSLGYVVEEEHLGYTNYGDKVTYVTFVHYGNVEEGYLRVEVLPGYIALDENTFIK